MAPELVAGGGYGGLIREKPHCAQLAEPCAALLPGASQPCPPRPRVVGNLRRPPKTCHSSSESWENDDSEYAIRYAGKIRPFLNFIICVTSGTIFAG